MYTSSSGKPTKEYKINHQLTLNLSTVSSLVTTAECSARVKARMSANMLKLKDEKAEPMLVRTKHRLNYLQDYSVVIGNSAIGVSVLEKSLGIIVEPQ